jgi:septal ring factor EnvC (AmiA/AmiB activator)
MDAPDRKLMFGWMVGLFLFLWMGYFFGYFVATDEAVSGLKQKEEGWKSKFEEAQSRYRTVATELDRAEKASAHQKEQLNEAHQAIVGLKLDLGRAQEAKQSLETRIALLEEALNVKHAQLRDIEQQLVRIASMSGNLNTLQSPLSIKQVITAKQAFNDMQHEVAAGNFKGLNLTPAYQRLRSIFDNPDLDKLIGLYDSVHGQGAP